LALARGTGLARNKTVAARPRGGWPRIGTGTTGLPAAPGHARARACRAPGRRGRPHRAPSLSPRHPL